MKMVQGNGFTSTATDFTICVWFLIYYVVGTLASISICIVALKFNFCQQKANTLLLFLDLHFFHIA